MVVLAALMAVAAVRLFRHRDLAAVETPRALGNRGAAEIRRRPDRVNRPQVAGSVAPEYCSEPGVVSVSPVSSSVLRPERICGQPP
jgi:hypothetical protein